MLKLEKDNLFNYDNIFLKDDLLNNIVTQG